MSRHYGLIPFLVLAICTLNSGCKSSFAQTVPEYRSAAIPPNGSSTNKEQSQTQALSERSKEITNEGVQRETEREAQVAKIRPVEEAFHAVEETRKAIQLLNQNQPHAARNALGIAIQKTDTVLSEHPNLSLVPIDFNIRVIDFSPSSEAAIKQITDETKKLIYQGQFQSARILLKGLASEINISTVNLPIATYPDVIRIASGLIEEGKIREAKARLLTAISNLVIIETIIPLPIVRAEALVEEAHRLVENAKFDKKQANQLVVDAEQQVLLAQNLGYIKNKNSFSELQNSIKALKKLIDSGQNQESKGLLAKMKNGLSELKASFSRP